MKKKKAWCWLIRLRGRYKNLPCWSKFYLTKNKSRNKDIEIKVNKEEIDDKFHYSKADKTKKPNRICWHMQEIYTGNFINETIKKRGEKLIIWKSKRRIQKHTGRNQCMMILSSHEFRMTQHEKSKDQVNVFFEPPRLSPLLEEV